MLGRLFDRALVVAGALSCAVVLFIMLSIDYGVTWRFVFRRPPLWVFDFSEYALVYLTFLAAALVLSNERHIKLDILLNTLSKRAQSLLNIITSVVGVVICGAFTWFSALLTWQAFQSHEIIWKSTIIAKGPLWAVMPIGSLLLTIQFGRRVWRYVQERRQIGEHV
ncbi:MAG: TRAP transporter small permease [Chloroflexi bacterium]|nr:TRAP transporter small permease [Chloroflexota bacterium]